MLRSVGGEIAGQARKDDPEVTASHTNSFYRAQNKIFIFLKYGQQNVSTR